MRNIEVCAAIIMKDHKYFCAKRKDQGELAKKWEFPGGKIEAGETREDALIREIKEELNTTIAIDRYLTTVQHQYNSFHLTMHAYECHIIVGDLELSEHLEAKWLSKDEMADYDFAAADIPIIALLK